MGSVYKDPKTAMDSATHQRLKSFVKTQRSFDKAYKQSVRVFLLSLAIVYIVLSFIAIYVASMEKFFNVSSFEQEVMENADITTYFYF
jgi:preprotein translocase subunit SecY